ncbi:hypothetical protein [Candidatus Methanodesulfokora washburnensis]|uniref:Uncharacterized protein n=1 Tax=Candidatus Methanodesulfokora washburnensis TaxID=2478471 RepID=A0A3R9QUT8_9CREN|nr:hypothetical protein [Candidatus Methanodesulfokores washburnensis]RSN72677.1 hypothetical protein D6D85_12815 [Candidatus Methanodesulfokores washburnensis]
MSEKETLKDKLRIEEIRGVFVLGLLAVLVSIRFGYKELLIYAGGPYFNLISGLIDITIVFWFLYAYLMVLGISEDVIGKKYSELFKDLSKFFLKMYFLLAGSVTVIFLAIVTIVFITTYPLRALVLMISISAVIAYSKREKLNTEIKKMKKKIKRKILRLKFFSSKY